MSTDNQNNISEEIDLGFLFKKINDFFGGISFSIFKVLLFIKRNILIFLGLIIFGAIGGYFLDYETTIYDTNIIVTPNLGGTDYLYSKIDLLSSKLKENDKDFFKSIGIQSDKIALIEIEPVIDIYSFVNNNTAIASSAQNTQNFELMKLLAESSDINKVIKDKITSKNYPHHNIHIVTVSKIKEDEIVKPLLNFLNTDKYLDQILSISRDNVEIRVAKDEELIAQTDSLINTLTKNLSHNQKSSNLVYNNENNQFNQLFETKNKLINELGDKKIEMVNLQSFIKDISTVTNLKNTKGTNGKMKLVLPILFILLFILFMMFKSFYKKQSAKLNKL
jgi:hypothetical protein